MVPRLSSVEGLCSSLLWTACLSVLVFLFYWRGVASFTRVRTTLSPTFSATKSKEVIPLMAEASDVLTGKLTEAAETGEDGKYDYFPEYCLLLAISFTNFSQSCLAMVVMVKSFLSVVNEIDCRKAVSPPSPRPNRDLPLADQRGGGGPGLPLIFRPN